MSDITIIVISILTFFLLIGGGVVWLVFVYFPNKSISVAKDIAETLKNTLGLSPQVTINQKIIYNRSNEILELAMIEQDFDVEYQSNSKWMKSEKQILLRGSYRAKIGFNLQKGFNIEVHRGGFMRPGHILLRLPHAEVLSVEPVDIQKHTSSGWINWVTNNDLDSATRQLEELARDKASKLEMLESAERRIESRLNNALLPRLVKHHYQHNVLFANEHHPLPSLHSTSTSESKVIEGK